MSRSRLSSCLRSRVHVKAQARPQELGVLAFRPKEQWSGGLAEMPALISRRNGAAVATSCSLESPFQVTG